jgi:hypothetical protein
MSEALTKIMEFFKVGNIKTKYYKVCIPASGSTLLLLVNVSELLDLPDPEELFRE